jgi:enediyne biosynthesis protein E4
MVHVTGCGRQPAVTATAAPGGPADVRFVEVAREAGITFRHQSGGSGRLYLPETMGSGCAFLDYDGDGRLDLFLVNASRLPGFRGQGPFYPALYRNLGSGKFEDVTQRAGLAAERYGMGVAVGDYDNDGNEDLFLPALGSSALYHNRGDGRFTDVTKAAGVASTGFSTSAAWVDFDRDGRLDLFVCSYCRWTPEGNQVCPDSFGRRHLCPPEYYQGISSRLYHNEGNGRFTDVTRRAGIYHPAGKALGILVWDVDDDGWPDLMVANDLEPNLLYRNNRNGTFTEIGVEAGVAYSLAGKARAGMGIDSADVEGRGREDVLIGNGATESLALFRADSTAGANPHFVDAAGPAGLAGPSLPYLTFGVLFVDYDLDGRKDILTANGHIDPNAGVIGGDGAFPQRMLLFHNEPSASGAPQFREVAAAAGSAMMRPRVHRGLAMGDYDGDGDPDFLVTVCGGAPLLLRNEALRARATAGSRHWLILKPVGVKSNQDGIGARFVVRAGGRRQTGWVRSGSSYASQSDLRAYFGLGSATTVDAVEVRWPSGKTEVLTHLPVDRTLVVREGQGLMGGPVTAARP